ncbi:hypothetical protein [Amycolatopsis thermoflava]|nr:hypothetical protein [Amycolatopsis thermoflava]
MGILKKADQAAQRRIDRALGNSKPQDEVAKQREKRQQKGGQK